MLRAGRVQGPQVWVQPIQLFASPSLSQSRPFLTPDHTKRRTLMAECFQTSILDVGCLALRLWYSPCSSSAFRVKLQPGFQSFSKTLFNIALPGPEICDAGKFAALTARKPFLGLKTVVVGRGKVSFPNASSFTLSILDTCCPKWAAIGRENIRSIN
jgi:hypothetical protein